MKYKVLSDLNINGKQYKAGDILESDKHYLLEQIGSLKIEENTKAEIKKPVKELIKEIKPKQTKRQVKKSKIENEKVETIDEKLNDL